jgi:hypothetical protein
MNTPAHASSFLRAIDALSATSPEYRGGLTDHAAMAVEALARLDPAAIDPFVARYYPRLRPMSAEPDVALHPFPSLVARERESLDRDGVGATLARHATATLAPGVVGAAFHGLLRVAHAARALARGDHPTLRDELARGLAYATLRTEHLPPRPPRASHTSDLTLDEALAALPPAVDALVDAPGLITGTLLARAAAHPTLGAVRARLRLDDDPVRAASDLRRAAVRLMTEGERHPESLFTILHGVTGMDAVCGLVPHLPRDAARSLVDAAGEALLALRVAYIGRLRATPVTTPADRFAAVRARAVSSLDDHAIKLAAALDEAERERPDPRHAVALALWVDRVT